MSKLKYFIPSVRVIPNMCMMEAAEILLSPITFIFNICSLWDIPV